MFGLPKNHSICRRSDVLLRVLLLNFSFKVILAACYPYCLPSKITKCRGSAVIYSMWICVLFYRSTDCVGNNTHIYTDMCPSMSFHSSFTLYLVAQSLKGGPRFVHAYAVHAVSWLYSVSHVSLLANSLSTAVCSSKGRTLESQLAENCLKNNGNQVSEMRMCLDVTWLPLVFPAESSDSILALFFALCENHPPLMGRYGKNRAWCDFQWLYLGRHFMQVVHLSYRRRDTREKKKSLNNIKFGIWMKKKIKLIFCVIMMLGSCTYPDRWIEIYLSTWELCSSSPAPYCSALRRNQDHMWEAGFLGMKKLRWHITLHSA